MSPAHEAALAACERDLRRLNKSPHTIAAVLPVARAFLARLGGLPLRRITTGDVRTLLAAEPRGDRPRAPATLVTRLGRLRCFFQALVRLGLGLLTEDPTAPLKLDRAPIGPRLLLSVKQVQQLLAAKTPPPQANRLTRALAARDRVTIVDRVARRAGVRCHPHSLRRAIGTHLVEAGLPVPLVQMYLGHRSVESTQHYVEVDRRALPRAIEVLDLGA